MSSREAESPQEAYDANLTMNEFVDQYVLARADGGGLADRWDETSEKTRRDLRDSAAKFMGEAMTVTGYTAMGLTMDSGERFAKVIQELVRERPDMVNYLATCAAIGYASVLDRLIELRKEAAGVE